MSPRRLRLPLPLLLSAALAAQANLVEVPPGREFQQHKVLTLGLTDTWEVEVAAGEFLHCVVETGQFDPVLELVDGAGERLGVDDGEGTRSELRRFAAADGKLAFRITGYEGRGGGSYRFWLLRYRTEALPLGPAPERAVAEHVFGPERWWHFRLALRQGDVVVPRVPCGGRLTAVLDRDQRALPEWHGGYTARRDGDVLLRVEGNEHDRCRVEVQRACRLALPEGGGLDGEVPDGGMHIVSLGFTPGAWLFELDSKDGDVVESFRDTRPAPHPRFRLMSALDKNDRLRQVLVVHEATPAELVIRNHGGPRGYRGRLVRIERPVDFGRPVADVMPLLGFHVFELDTAPGQLVRITARSEAFDARMELWTPDGGAQGFDDGGPLDLDPQHTFLVTRPGVHRVLVGSPAGGGSGPFTLLAERLPVPTLGLDEPMPVAVRGGTPFAHLALTAGQDVWLSVQSTAFDAMLRVHDPDGRHLGDFDGGGIGGDVLFGLRADRTGAYTLQVFARSGAGAGVLRAIRP